MSRFDPNLNDPNLNEGIKVRNEEGKLAVKEVLPGLKGREKRSPAQPA